MALLHMTYDREPNIKNMRLSVKVETRPKVHQVTEADVRRYYKEITTNRADAQPIQKNHPWDDGPEGSPSDRGRCTPVLYKEMTTKGADALTVKKTYIDQLIAGFYRPSFRVSFCVWFFFTIC
ncbi:unnamed protein product [Caenorhabditis nigoni]